MKNQHFFRMSSKQLEMGMVKVAYSQRTYFLLSTTSTARQVAVFRIVFWTNQKKNTKWRSRICNQGVEGRCGGRVFVTAITWQDKKNSKFNFFRVIKQEPTFCLSCYCRILWLCLSFTLDHLTVVVSDLQGSEQHREDGLVWLPDPWEIHRPRESWCRASLACRVPGLSQRRKIHQDATHPNVPTPSLIFSDSPPSHQHNLPCAEMFGG